jgi:hypothetical protein
MVLKMKQVYMENNKKKLLILKLGKPQEIKKRIYSARLSKERKEKLT